MSSRHCKNDPEKFCYMCGRYTFPRDRKPISKFVRETYFEYFKINICHQEKSWVPHKICKSCLESLRGWKMGKQKYIHFASPMIWRELTNHSEDCYFCKSPVVGFNTKNKGSICYPNVTVIALLCISVSFKLQRQRQLAEIMRTTFYLLSRFNVYILFSTIINNKTIIKQSKIINTSIYCDFIEQ